MRSLRKVFTCVFFVMISVVYVNSLYAMTDYADLVEELSPAVVNISTKTNPDPSIEKPNFNNPFRGTPFEDLFKGFGEQFKFNLKPQQSLGSGVVISKDGYVVTNNHVVEGADKIVVKFNNDREEYEAKLIGCDGKNDLALIKLEDKVLNIKIAKLGDSNKVRVGEAVIAIGNPFGLGGTVTAGIISALGRNIGQGPYDDFIQTDAAINPGNSGGPLFNKNGELVGINTAIFSRTGGSNGIGFAIPINTVKLVVEQIKKYGHPVRGWLGVRIQHITPQLAESLKLQDDIGALVAEVVEKSPAEKAKIEAGDVILRYNYQNIVEMADLPRLVAETDVGAKIVVEILRDGKSKKVKVIIAELEEDDENSEIGTDIKKEDDSPEKILGLNLKPLTDKLRDEMGVPESLKGLVVMNISYGSVAMKAGVMVGDILVEINMTPLAAQEP